MLAIYLLIMNFYETLSRENYLALTSVNFEFIHMNVDFICLRVKYSFMIKTKQKRSRDTYSHAPYSENFYYFHNYKK